VMGVPFGTYNLTNPGSIDAQELVGRMKYYGVMSNDVIKKYESIEEFDKTSSIPRSNTYLNTYKLEDAGVKVRSCSDAVNES
ncbi:hypothetical protein, partial [Streptococcus pneumoniae]|uniref:hypothetical protein n=1 Tax=Streptococcus pneumoniae TaxID=1313 RepID=UPI001E5A53F3